MMTTLGTSADGHTLPGCRLRRVTTVCRRALGITPGAYRTTVALREDRPGREGG
jgi:hypothetical protein